jgi:protein pelota
VRNSYTYPRYLGNHLDVVTSLIVTELSPKHGNCSLIIESADDLWTLRRLISKGDVLVTRSSRIQKREQEFARPDKGERVKVTIALRVDEVHLDSSIERVRVRGTIVEASDESVTITGSHSVALTPGRSLTLRKERWTPFHTRLLRPSGSSSRRFLIVAVDRREAGVGTLSGSHLSVAATLESGLGGKMSDEPSSGPFISKIADLVSQEYRQGDEIVVAGPGNFKGAVSNQIRGRTKAKVTLVEGFDLTGGDGVRAFVKDRSFQSIAEGSQLVELQRMVTEVVRRISTGDPKVAYGLPRIKDAALAGAIDACAVSDNVFASGVDEDELVDVLNAVEAKGGVVYLADSSLEFGKQVSSFGGVVALLRYAVRA